MNRPIVVTITGAAGQIGYALAPRIAAGEMLGREQPVVLKFLDVPSARNALLGVEMELHDSDFPLLQEVVITDDLETGFRDTQIALLVGARPRSEDMVRADLILANGPIFAEQGKILNEVADRDVKVLVVGNPANTNALIAMHNAPDLARRQFSAMTRLDHNRALYQVSKQLDCPVAEIRKISVWGNHSATQVIDVWHAEARGESVAEQLDDYWLRSELIPRVQLRGEEVIRLRGKSSAMSAANAVIDAIHDWCNGTREGDWVSMALSGGGEYGIDSELVFSYPVTVADHVPNVVQKLSFNRIVERMIGETTRELVAERDTVRHLM